VDISAAAGPDHMKRIKVDIMDDSLLWLVNRSVFHPRGYALAHDPETGEFLLYGDGDEPFVFPGNGAEDVSRLARIKELMP
jgi:hypothetical protein